MKQRTVDPLLIARKAFDQSDYLAAQHYFQLAARLHPDRTEPLLKLSACAGYMGQPRSARSHAMGASLLTEHNPVLLAGLAEQLSLVGESEAAFRVIQKMQPEMEMPTMSKASIAGTLHRIIKLDEALCWIGQAATEAGNDSRHASIFAFHGQLLRFHNRRGDAYIAYEKALQLDPHNAQACLGRSLIQHATPEHQHIDSLRKVLGRCKPNSRSEAQVAYALFKELDDVGDHAAAWPILERAWRAKRNEKTYNAALESALFERLSALTPKLRAGELASEEKYPIPIFIVGQPRSGSTLLERLLAQHHDVEAAGELFDFMHQLHWCADISAKGFVSIEAAERVGTQDLSTLGQRYLDHVKWRANGKKYVIDKLPPNYLLAAFIAKAIPQAVMIHSVRDSMDTCYSQLKECFDHGYEHSYSPDDMANHYLGYQDFMQRLQQDMPGRIHNCDHSVLIDEPEIVTRQLFEFCGLDFKQEYLAIDADKRAVSTASSSQVRSRINREGVGRWQPYASQLESMQKKLGA